jgi:hypothetical protein
MQNSEAVEVVPPQLLDGAATSSFMPATSEPSALMSARHITALAAALPPRFRTNNWSLVYRWHGGSGRGGSGEGEDESAF